MRKLKLNSYKISKLRNSSAVQSCHLPSWLSQDGAKSCLLNLLEHIDLYFAVLLLPKQIERNKASYLKFSSALRSPIQHVGGYPYHLAIIHPRKARPDEQRRRISNKAL
jgi:hypothetical protein